MIIIFFFVGGRGGVVNWLKTTLTLPLFENTSCVEIYFVGCGVL